MQPTSKAWIYFTGSCFTIALTMILAGIILMPTEIWVKAYLTMGTLFLVATSFTLSKTVRDTSDQRSLAASVDKSIFARILRESDMCVR